MSTGQSDRDARGSTRMIDFDGLAVAYDSRVLEPRPWTQLQSRWAAELAAGTHAPILELFAGVGHIGLAAARRARRPLLQIEADPLACGFAVENAWRAGMAHCVTVRCGDVGSVIPADEEFSVVIADPPYLPTSEMSAFPDDPPSAVDGGSDGLGPARRCLHAIDANLRAATPVLLQLRGVRQIDELVDSLDGAVEVEAVRCDGPDRAVALLVTSRSTHPPVARLQRSSAVGSTG